MELKPNEILAIRLTIGFGQGLALYLLLRAIGGRTPLDPLLATPLIVIFTFVPVVAIASLGNLRLRTFAIWIISATVVCAALAYYDIYRDSFESAVRSARFIPTAPLWTALGAGLFIAQSLIVAADAERTPIASYPRHFDVSWKHGVQFVLAALFVGLFWLLFVLGASLFALIGINVVWQLLLQPSFLACATALALAVALHVTDVRPEMVRGMRTLTLVLLSWLLPIIAAFALLFVLMLPFTGVELLWATKRATLILVSVCASLLLLINAAYQDGRHAQDRVARMGIARAAATLALAPLVAIAGYALYLRVLQYGFTPQRVIAAAGIFVLACYAAGYLLALARHGFAQRWIEWTNVATAYVVLAVLASLVSPIADPARLSVAHQLHRLESGIVDPEEFDFAFLRFHSGRNGQDALARLGGGDDSSETTKLARAALQHRSLSEMRAKPKVEITPEIRAANILSVHPSGVKLPETFLAQNWNTKSFDPPPSCLTTQVTCADDPRAPGKRKCTPAHAQCEAIVTDIDGDDRPEVMIFSARGGSGSAFKLGDDGQWTTLGRLHNVSCSRVRDGLGSGNITTVSSLLKELEVNGQRIQVLSNCQPPPQRPARMRKDSERSD